MEERFSTKPAGYLLIDSLSGVVGTNELVKLQNMCREVYIEDSVRKYATSISRATRSHDDIKPGASPRASLGLHLASKALAAVRGRHYVIPDDIKYLAAPVMAHRLIPKTGIRLKGHSMGAIVRRHRIRCARTVRRVNKKRVSIYR